MFDWNTKTITNAKIQFSDIDVAGKGRHFKSRFIQPGIAGYPGQFGNVLITKETLNKFIDTMVGSPVVIKHKELDQNNVNEERVGVVNSVWFDDNDGWFWCDGVIWDETAINLIKDQGWNVSCAYKIKEANNDGGSENNINYDMEFLDGVFEHLAIVDNPRYERAQIVLNAKEVINGDVNKYPAGAPDGKGGQFAPQEQSGGEEEDPYSATGHSELLSSIVGKAGYSQIKFFRNKPKDKPEYYAYRAETSPHLREAYEKHLQKRIDTKHKGPNGRRSRWFNNGIDVIIYKGNVNNSKQGDKMIIDALKNLVLHVENAGDDKGRWITVKGTHVFVREGQAVEDAMKETFGNKDQKLTSQQIAHRKGGLLGEISKAQSVGLKDKEKKLRARYDKLRAQEAEIREEAEALKGKYEREDVDFDVDQLKKDIKTVQRYGYEEVEEIAEFLGLDEDEVRETMSDSDRSKHSFDKEGFEKFVKAKNSKEYDMTILEELKKFITKVENEKGEDMEDKKKKDVENEKVDKRKLIDEVAGIMKSAGCDDEIIRTAIGKMEKIGYDESEAGTADNKKVKNEDEKEEDKKAENKCKNEDEEDEKKVEEVKEDVKEDVENKCKNSIFNSKENFFEKLNAIYNSANEVKETTLFKTREERLEAGKKF